nr:MAG TPA: hypothetical protein [Caudoviricetes sp.]
MKSPSTLAIIFVEVEIQRKRSSTKLNDRRSVSLSGKQAMTVNDASVPRSRNRVSVRQETTSGKTANKFTGLSA